MKTEIEHCDVFCTGVGVVVVRTKPYYMYN